MYAAALTAESAPAATAPAQHKPKHRKSPEVELDGTGIPQATAEPTPPAVDTGPPSAEPKQAADPAPAASPPATLSPEMGARVLDREVTAYVLWGIIGRNDLVSPDAAKLYLNTLTTGVTDPVEKMLLEGLALAHHRVGFLHFQAHKEKTLEAIKIYNAAAARLMGEIRLTAQTLKTYRAPSVSVVHQQNVVAGGGKQTVQYLDQSPTGGRLARSHDDSELNGNGHDYVDEQPELVAEFTANDRWLD